MEGYYETLGLEPGASQMEIKKAYFKLVRQYSPESDPEKFQKIREAYEQLKNAQNKPEGPVFPAIDDPWAEKMMKQIQNLLREGNMELCRDTCEEAYRLFPENIQFLYYLAIAQRKCGNTGKAVKSAELLAKKEPGNRWFQKELAISYVERGFKQKAYAACEKAYESGCRDTDFILKYAGECNEYGQYDKGTLILLDVIRQEKKWRKEEMKELAQVYLCLLEMNRKGMQNHLTEILERFCQLFEQYGIFMTEYLPELSMMLARIAGATEEGRKERGKVGQIFDVMWKVCRTDSEKSCLNDAREEFSYQRLMNDSRIGETFRRGYEAYFGMDDLDPSILKFAVTDTQLCMIEEREESLEQAEVVRQEYPEFYEKIQDFIQKLKAEKNLVYLKDSLQKSYRRMEQYIDGGFYYEKYPQEKRKAEGTRINETWMEEPYVRGTKKIGRNDPCPCGSGKKYKHCCLNKTK